MMRIIKALSFVALFACREEQKDLPPLGVVLARLDDPIARPCEDVRDAVVKAFASGKPKRYRSLETTAVDGGYRMVGPWSVSSPKPHGFRVIVTLHNAGNASCRADVISERLSDPSAKLWSVPDREAKLQLVAVFDPAKAREIREQLRNMKY